MQALMLQHGDFFGNLSVTAPTVPRVDFAADEKLRDPHACNVADHFGDFFFRAPSCCRTESVSTLSLSRPISRWNRSSDNFCH